MTHASMSRRRLALNGLALAAVGWSGGAARAHAPAAAPDPATVRPGFLFVTGFSINREAMGRYARTLPAIYQKYQGYYLATGGPTGGVTVLESDWKPRSVILAKFPTIEAVNEFWWSPEYRESVAIRAGAGEFTVVRLKGRPGDAAKPKGKPAYLIGINEIRDRAKNAEYGKAALPILNEHGGRLIAGGGRKDIELLEGDFGNKNVTVVEFADLAALRAFYNDPRYQALIPIRQASGDSTVIEIDGVAQNS
ncbi:MAG: DUF1330 domain-containing protein [Rhodospirillaceae bacterium]|nr:DUF1330 domain-containing protein [Rhodospirillaceae bacterium]